MVAAPALPPQVYVPERARTGSAVVRHLVGRPSTLRLVTTGLVTTVFAPPEAVEHPERRPGTQDEAFRTRTARLAIVELSGVPNPELVTITAQPQKNLRLTPRGRAVLVVLTIFGALAFLLIAHAGSSSATGSGPTGSLRSASSVTVHDGDTLWEIANRVEPGDDPRAVVDRIRSLNHLDSAALQAGQTLRLR
jgi:nucleoid-associated protein YgaU